jgi:hypothetical protein
VGGFGIRDKQIFLNKLINSGEYLIPLIREYGKNWNLTSMTLPGWV